MTPMTSRSPTTGLRSPARARRSRTTSLAASPTKYRLEPLRDARHRIVGTIGVGINVSKRRHQLLEFQRSEAWLADAQRIGHIGSWEWDPAQNRLNGSEELYRIYDLDPATFDHTFESFIGRLPKEDGEKTKSIVFDAMRAPEPLSPTTTASSAKTASCG